MQCQKAALGLVLPGRALDLAALLCLRRVPMLLLKRKRNLVLTWAMLAEVLHRKVSAFRVVRLYRLAKTEAWEPCSPTLVLFTVVWGRLGELEILP